MVTLAHAEVLPSGLLEYLATLDLSHLEDVGVNLLCRPEVDDATFDALVSAPRGGRAAVAHTSSGGRLPDDVRCAVVDLARAVRAVRAGADPDVAVAPRVGHTARLFALRRDAINRGDPAGSAALAAAHKSLAPALEIVTRAARADSAVEAVLAAAWRGADKGTLRLAYTSPVRDALAGTDVVIARRGARIGTLSDRAAAHPQDHDLVRVIAHHVATMGAAVLAEEGVAAWADMVTSIPCHAVAVAAIEWAVLVKGARTSVPPAVVSDLCVNVAVLPVIERRAGTGSFQSVANLVVATHERWTASDRDAVRSAVAVAVAARPSVKVRRMAAWVTRLLDGSHDADLAGVTLAAATRRSPRAAANTIVHGMAGRGSLTWSAWFELLGELGACTRVEDLISAAVGVTRDS